MRQIFSTIGAIALGLAAVGPLPAQTAPQSDFAKAQAAYHALPDTPGTGRYPATKLTDPAFPDHVVYRPANLQALGQRKLPVFLWGSGGCSDDGASERFFLSEIASHGYLAIAPGNIYSGPGEVPPPPPPPAGTQLSARTTAQQVLQGLDQALAANAAPGLLHGRIDTSRIAVGGYSCGGLQALVNAGDPRIKAVVIMHSGIFNQGGEPIKGMHVEKSLLDALHTPVLYLLGGPSDIAYPNGSDDVARIDKVPVFYANHNVGHGGTYQQPNGGEEAQVVRNWLEWQLFGDATAGKTFTGADCTLCKNPEWTVVRKKF